MWREEWKRRRREREKEKREGEEAREVKQRR